MDDTLVGIISLEDLIKALEDGEMDTLVGSKMTSGVETLYSDDSAVQAVNRMARFGYGRFPVVNRSGKLVGILTRGDILRGLLRRLEVNYREEEIQRYRASHIFRGHCLGSDQSDPALPGTGQGLSAGGSRFQQDQAGHRTAGRRPAHRPAGGRGSL